MGACCPAPRQVFGVADGATRWTPVYSDDLPRGYLIAPSRGRFPEQSPLTRGGPVLIGRRDSTKAHFKKTQLHEHLDTFRSLNDPEQRRTTETSSVRDREQPGHGIYPQPIETAVRESAGLRFESLAQHRQVACRGRLGPTGEGPAGGRVRSYQRGEVVGR